MGPGIVLFMAVIMAGATLITLTSFHYIHKIEKAKAGAREGGMLENLKRQVDKLTSANARLQKRVETLEAIVVDTDMEKLQTGLDSHIEPDSLQKTTSIEINIDEGLPS